MDQATLAHIFEPFFTTKSEGKGTGLGLSVIHSIMQQHDGAVTVESSPGQGTVFHCYFPVATAAAMPSEAPPPETEQGQGAHILCIDDETTLVFLMSQVLQRLGYRTTSYTDAPQALAHFQTQPYAFDVVITDLAMTSMSGFALAEALQRIRPDIPIILSSGYLQQGDQETAQRLGIRAVMAKPTTVKALTQALQRCGKAPASGEQGGQEPG
jgi:CheY-like chemotaxis protein